MIAGGGMDVRADDVQAGRVGMLGPTHDMKGGCATCTYSHSALKTDQSPTTVSHLRPRRGRWGPLGSRPLGETIDRLPERLQGAGSRDVDAHPLVRLSPTGRIGPPREDTHA